MATASNVTMIQQDLYIGATDFANFKCWAVLQYDFSGQSAQIVGPCRSGKTSVLDGIAWILGMVDARQMPDIIRNGTKKATGQLQLVNGEAQPKYVVRRDKTEKGEKVEVTAADGSTPDECDPPGQWLKGIVDKVAYDLMEFVYLRPQDQRDRVLELKKILPPVSEVREITGQTIEPEEGENVSAYMSRISADRIGLYYLARKEASKLYDQKKKAHQEAIQRHKDLGGVEGEKEETTSEITLQIEGRRRVQDEWKKAQNAAREARFNHDAAKTKLADRKKELSEAETKYTEFKRPIEQAFDIWSKDNEERSKSWEAFLAGALSVGDMRQRCQAMEDKWSDLSHRVKMGEDAVASLESESKRLETIASKKTNPQDEIDRLTESLRTIDERNKTIRARLAVEDEIARLEDDAEAAREDFSEAETVLQKLRDLRAKLLEGIDLGVPGLSIGEGELLLNGHSFRGSASTSEQIVVCFALMALHFEQRKAQGLPTLRIIRVDRAESLDEEAMELILRLAREHEIQAIFTRVQQTETRKAVFELLD